MANDNKGTSPVATSAGQVVKLPDLTVPANRIYNFVEINRKAYFEEHSLEWCLDQIIERGIAEITRSVKNQVKTAKDRAAGALLKELNMSPGEAKAKLLELLAAQSKANATQ